MNLRGEFVEPPRPPVSSRILLWAIVVAIVAGAISIAALVLWIAAMVLPVALVAAAVAWGMWRYRMWRMQRAVASHRDLWRP